MSNMLYNSCVAFGKTECVKKFLTDLLAAEGEDLTANKLVFPTLANRNLIISDIHEQISDLSGEFTQTGFTTITNYTNFPIFDQLGELYDLKIAVSVIDESDGKWYIYNDEDGVFFSESILLDVYDGGSSLESYKFFDTYDNFLSYIDKKPFPKPFPRDYLDASDTDYRLSEWDLYMRDLSIGLVRVADRLRSEKDYEKEAM